MYLGTNHEVSFPYVHTGTDGYLLKIRIDNGKLSNDISHIKFS